MTTVQEIRNDLRKIAAPLREQLELVNARLNVLDAERAELQTARRELSAVLSRLNGERPIAAKPGPKPSGGVSPKVASAVARFLAAHPKKYPDGFTASGLERDMKAAKVYAPSQN